VTSLDETTVIPVIVDDFDQRARNDGFDRWDSSADANQLLSRRTAVGRLAWMLPLLVAAGVGLVRPTWASLSGSELAIWATTKVSWAELVGFVRNLDSPHTVLMWAWAKLAGTSDLSLRLPSIAFIAGTAALVGLIGSRLVTPKVGFVAGLLFAVLPVTSRFAQDAGPMAAAVFSAALATFCLLRLVDRPRIGSALVYAVACTILLAFGPGAAPILLAHFITVVTMRRSALAHWLTATVLAVLPAALLYLFVFPWPAKSAAVTPELLALAMGGTVILGGVLMGLASISFSTHKPALLFSAWALVPPLAAIAISSLTGRSVLAFVLLAIPAWALLAAMSLRSMPAVRSIMVLILIAALGASAHQAFRSPAGHGQATAALANTIMAEFQAEDAIVFGATDAEALLGRDIVARYVAEPRRPADLLLARAPRQQRQLYAAECADPAQCLAPAQRIWVIRSGAPSDPLDGFAPAKDGYLRVNFAVDKRWQFDGLTLVLLVPVPEAG
jgi:mannosyltransferase